MEKKEYEHQYVPELKNLYRTGRISRREFMRNALLLGISAVAANSFLSACSPGPSTETTPDASAVPESSTSVPSSSIRRGGIFRVSGDVIGLDHPARASNDSPFSIVNEYLTITDADNVTHPHLLERWEPSEDLKTWTLHLRQGVTWSTGELFTADDVLFTMNEWLNPDVGSSMLGLMGNYLLPQNIEKVDDYTVVLHLESPQIAVPEHLYATPAVMLDHRTFGGDWLQNPVGTGAFVVDEWSIGERAVLKAREGYWAMGDDGSPLPYLDEFIYVAIGSDPTARLSALTSGQIDAYLPWSAPNESLRENPDIAILSVATANTPVLRMRVDMEPWTDVRVRNALKLCQDKEKILQLAQFGEGIVGPDCHVAPVQPEYCPMPITPYNPDQAKALLTEAGYPDGLDVTITVGSGWPDTVSYAEILREDSAPAGFRMTINSVPNDVYWDLWTEVDLGVTIWSHRPLAVMTLPVAYTCDREGNPVPWNETRWCDEEFAELLQQAMGTVDVEERRQIMCDIQRIQVERGSIGIPYWKNVWLAYNRKFQGLTCPTSTTYAEWVKIWYDPDA